MNVLRRRAVQSLAGLGAAVSLPFVAGCSTAGPAAGATAAPSGAAAAATPATSEGFLRIRFGAKTIIGLADGHAERPVEAFVRNVSDDQVRQALGAAGLPTDKVRITFTAALLEADGQRILFDGGNGEFGAPTSGRLLASLAKAGVQPDQIDHVIVSHFHGDHINGLRTRAGELTFPKARIHVPAVEWAFWMDEDRQASAPEAMKGAFGNVRRVFGPIGDKVHRFYSGSEVVAGVRSVAAFGHTPGHTIFTVEDGNQTWAYLADLTNIPALFARHPDWAVVFDMDPDAARRVRRQVFQQAADETWLVSGYHFPTPGIGQITRRGDGFEFTAAGQSRP